MICIACLACLVSTVSGSHKNTLGRAIASSGHTTKLEQSTFLRYLWLKIFKVMNTGNNFVMDL